MEIDHRQKKILETVIEEYIGSAQPVSSLQLSQKILVFVQPLLETICFS
jgi:transcriptional regulator of heat shock response